MGQLTEHLLSKQTSFGPQAVPQPPQFFGSMSTRMQALLHRSQPSGQVHWEFLQMALSAQATPQAPQFIALLARSAQVPLQLVIPGPQSLQTPLMQNRSGDGGAKQTTPQAPQLL